MAPSPKEIEQALLDGTYEVYSTAPDDTTVNKVRGHVEEKLGLDDGFFSTGDWKSKSKVVIKGRVVCSALHHSLPSLLTTYPGPVT